MILVRSKDFCVFNDLINFHFYALHNVSRLVLLTAFPTKIGVTSMSPVT